MKKYLVISAIGPDRPGIVDAVSDCAALHGCNLDESRMAVLGGEFAIIVLFTGQEKNILALRKALPALGKKLKLSISARPTSANPPVRKKDYLPYALKVNGMDQQGLVHSVTHVLAEKKINIQSLTTGSANAPVSGTPLFNLVASLEVPVSVSIAGLRQDLDTACNTLNIDYDLEQATAR